MNKDKIKLFAPVIIATLCRFDHFKRCLDSLENCTWAEYTDVYVGLDYPSSEKHVEGWKKIDSFLADKEKNNRFRNLYVHRRDYNCGVEGPNSNFELLIREVRCKFDRIIISEDDNEFSPNFLDYMNKTLEMFKDDDRVMSVSGYNHKELQGISSDTIYCSIDSPAYGFGCWNDKDAKLDKWEYDDIQKELRNHPLKSMALAFKYPNIINMLITMINMKKNYGDLRRTTYNMFHNTFCLCPTLSLSRNWGCDGSGVHGGVFRGIETNEISSEREFDIKNISFKLPKNYDYLLNSHTSKGTTLRYRLLITMRMAKQIL